MGLISRAMIGEIARLCPGGVVENLDLAAISSWRIGGPADLVVRPSSTAQVAALRRWFAAHGVEPVVIGLTSNLLFDDAGLRVPVIQISERLSAVDVGNGIVSAEAGIWVPGLACRLMRAGLTGGEHICGIPGTLGGLICMNGGSQRKGIGMNLVTVESVDSQGEVHTRSAADCQFAYRSSIFQRNDEIITRARLRFDAAPPAGVRRTMLQILVERSRKFPRKQPNCGSVFKSNPAMYAEIGPPGEAIERLGFKGMREGGALVSPQHANFVVNAGGATACDVLTLIARISKAVRSATGYQMEAEVYFVNSYGVFQSADSVLAVPGS